MFILKLVIRMKLSNHLRESHSLMEDGIQDFHEILVLL